MSGLIQPYKRKTKERPVQVTYCIVVEGQKTEKNYFSDARAEFDQLQRERERIARNSGQLGLRRAALNIIVAGGGSFVDVVRKALSQAGLGHEKIWCVVDADLYGKLQGKQRESAESIRCKAESKGIEIIFSRPCFEVWYRHHFNADSSALEDGDRAKAEVQRIWPAYQQKPDRHWEILRDRLCNEALRNAQRVRSAHGSRPAEDCDASSDVDWLIYELFCQIDPNDPTTS